jgi:hypothetical protein
MFEYPGEYLVSFYINSSSVIDSCYFSAPFFSFEAYPLNRLGNIDNNYHFDPDNYGIPYVATTSDLLSILSIDLTPGSCLNPSSISRIYGMHKKKKLNRKLA